MDVPIWAVLLFFCGRFLVGWVLDRPVDSTVKVEEFPLLNVTEDSLDPETFQRLRNAVVGANGLASSKWSRGNQLNAGFKDTKGFVLRFNEEGVDDAFAGDFAPLRPFWQAVRAPEDNAFVLNLVYVSAADCANVGDAAVALHIDETVGIDSARVFLAHAVSVLYLEAAVDTKGGRLELFANISYDDMAHAQDGFLQTPPDASVGPFPNRLAVFRGNAHHRVSRYCAASPAAPRVSLVLEAYRIEPRYYASTTKFEVLGEDHRVYGAQIGMSYSTAALAKFRWQSGGVAAQAGHGAVLTALALVLIVAFTKVTAKKKED
ncbi:hypothetical protein M885DRAFT_461032 [Pelagophyceae sp. CCMP2097]|nr:hypothetical protein M885DRAFT_461032 [Pelagophyceae sp. CCMP2097]|mmetsp:Transcript_31869/g.107333  ORF Transcript_31869/g.107333 Transcript_31869/m.107333 type:complete len:319 (+) Transcript_31869:54-1010(+)